MTDATPDPADAHAQLEEVTGQRLGPDDDLPVGWAADIERLALTLHRANHLFDPRDHDDEHVAQVAFIAEAIRGAAYQLRAACDAQLRARVGRRRITSLGGHTVRSQAGAWQAWDKSGLRRALEREAIRDLGPDPETGEALFDPDAIRATFDWLDDVWSWQPKITGLQNIGLDPGDYAERGPRRITVLRTGDDE